MKTTVSFNTNWKLKTEMVLQSYWSLLQACLVIWKCIPRTLEARKPAGQLPGNQECTSVSVTPSTPQELLEVTAMEVITPIVSLMHWTKYLRGEWDIWRKLSASMGKVTCCEYNSVKGCSDIFKQQQLQRNSFH